MRNCTTCKWWRLLKDPKRTEKQLGLKESEVLKHCDECVAEFSVKWKGLCRNCAWKDRNLPYWQRKRHCDACARSFAATSPKRCETCQWNDPKRPQPSDASLAHCKACMEVGGDSRVGKRCDTCPAMRVPTERRRAICLRCSVEFSGNRMVVDGTNELSNKGETFVSYDNHNSEMTDDRDVVAQVSQEYTLSLRPSTEHPVASLTRLNGESDADLAKRIFDSTREFLDQLARLPDMQALLFLSKIKGEKSTDFARNHGLADSVVHQLYRKLVMSTPVFRAFMKSLCDDGKIDRIVREGGVEKKTGSRAGRKRECHAGIRQMEFSFVSDEPGNVGGGENG